MFKNIISTFFTRFFIAGSNLIIAVLLSNFMGASGRGEQSLFITLISFIIIITSLIGASSISYLLPRNSFWILIIPSYIWIFLVISVCFIILPFLNLLPAIYTIDVCVLALLLSVLNINIAVLISHQKINLVNILNLIQSLIIILFLFISFAVFHNKNINTYINSLYAGYGGTLIISFFFIRGFFRNYIAESYITWITAFKKLAILGFYNQIAVFTQLLSFRLSYYILNASFGKEEVGIYSNAVSIAESVWLIARSIGTVQHSKIVNSQSVNYSLTLTSKLNKINISISVALILVMIFIPESWYVFLFGDEFRNLNRIIWTISPGILFFSIALVLGYYFSSTGKHYVNAMAGIAGLIITVITGYTIIPSYSSYGAGITASLSYFTTAMVVVFFYIREKKRCRLESQV